MSDRICTPVARLSYPAIFHPGKPMNPNDEPKYGVELIFEKGTNLDRLKAEAERVKKAKWGDKEPKGLRWPFRDGSERQGDGYENCTFIGARNSDKPKVVDADGEPIIDQSEVYGGCYVKALLTCYAYDKPTNKGVTFSLNAIQLWKEGEAFGNRVDAKKEFAVDDQDADAHGIDDANPLI